MSTPYTRKAFQALYDELFTQLVQRDWVIAASLAVECHGFIDQAFGRGYRAVANACLKQLDDLVSPVATHQYKRTYGYNGLWALPEMKTFVLKNLEYSAEQALALSQGITAENVDLVVQGLVRRGVLEPMGDEDGEEIFLTGRYCVELVAALLDQKHHDAAVVLIMALATAELVEKSDFYVDHDFARCLARLDETGLNIQQIMKSIEAPLLDLSTMNRPCGNSYDLASLADLQAIAELGAPQLAKRLLLDGDYCAEPIDLCAFAEAIGTPFTRHELITIGQYRDGNVNASGIWLGSVLKYWLHHQDVGWPYACGQDESYRVDSRLIKSATACSTVDEIPDEVANHGVVMAAVFDDHSFASATEKDRLLEKVVRLHLAGHNDEESAACIEGFFRSPLKAIAMRTLSHEARDHEFGTDLGL
ncbi:hypothetical protein IFT48_02280 [Pseudomonas fluorescens]|uniref:hypothetical protein n=1 Tax=Pseudomonas fluorescens TaxID=294 RepID=UPI001930C256|nr:hypothetical protein [Pseudomonas fluorescens]MBD8088791.1 hypothetical protein [Pseudomonas fluorescens]